MCYGGDIKRGCQKKVCWKTRSFTNHLFLIYNQGRSWEGGDVTSHKTHFKSESLTPFPLSLFHSTTFSFVSLFPISFPSSFFLWTSLLYSRSLSLFLCTLDTSSSLLLLQFLSLLLMNMTSVLCLISMMSTMKQNCLSMLFVCPREFVQGGHSGFAR